MFINLRGQRKQEAILLEALFFLLKKKATGEQECPGSSRLMNTLKKENKGEIKMNEELKQRITNMIKSKKVFLFMKGTPEAPECGFSMRVVNILKLLNIDFGSFNVLSDPNIRQGIKEYAHWPTIPQLYINEQFIGGCDITEQLYDQGKLQELVREN